MTAGAYLPFGIGPRVCAGAAFAQVEAVLLVARLVRRFDFTSDGAARPAARLTTRPVGQIMGPVPPVRMNTAPAHARAAAQVAGPGAILPAAVARGGGGAVPAASGRRLAQRRPQHPRHRAGHGSGGLSARPGAGGGGGGGVAGGAGLGGGDHRAAPPSAAAGGRAGARRCRRISSSGCTTSTASP